MSPECPTDESSLEGGLPENLPPGAGKYVFKLPENLPPGAGKYVFTPSFEGLPENRPPGPGLALDLCLDLCRGCSTSPVYTLLKVCTGGVASGSVCGSVCGVGLRSLGPLPSFSTVMPSVLLTCFGLFFVLTRIELKPLMVSSLVVTM